MKTEDESGITQCSCDNRRLTQPDSPSLFVAQRNPQRRESLVPRASSLFFKVFIGLFTFQMYSPFQVSSPQTSLSPCISVPSASMKLLSHGPTDSPASSRAFPYAELSSLSFLRRLLTATAQVCDAFPAVAGLAEGRVKQRPRPRRRRRERGGGGGGNETV